MRTIIYHKILFAAAVTLLSSCTKVIDVDLNSKEPQIVIEGKIDNRATIDTVLITNTVNFSESNSFPAVSGATVSITDDLGATEVLTEVIPGKYIIKSMQGVPGRKYILSVFVNNKTYKAESTMPMPVNMDSLIVQKNAGFGGDAIQILPVFLDPAGKVNFYRFKEYINGKRVDANFLYNDRLRDGLPNARALRSFGVDDEIKIGDKIWVEMYCIDEANYKYFYSLNQNTNGQTAAPANPVTNWSNGALGYFSAHTLQVKTVTIQ